MGLGERAVSIAAAEAPETNCCFVLTLPYVTSSAL